MLLHLLLLLFIEHSTCSLALQFLLAPMTASNAWAQPNEFVHIYLHLTTEEEILYFSDFNSLALLPPHSQTFNTGKTNFNLKRRNATSFAAFSKAPAMEGDFTLVWGHANAAPIASFSLTLSCSDGNVCNGMERLTRTGLGSPTCVKSKRALCDDLNGCTKDTCFHRGICSYSKKPASKGGNACKKCKTSKCKPQCKEKECGFDQCFGSCGECPHPSSMLCASQKCVEEDGRSGTCFHPIPLTPAFRGLGYTGMIVQTVPMHLALDVLTPRCQISSNDDGGGSAPSAFPEIMYELHMPSDRGYISLEVRTMSTNSSGYQPVTLVIIEADPADKELPPQQVCLRATFKQEVQWACSFDYSDLGSWSNSATWMMKPGFVYYVAVERAWVPSLNVAVQFRMIPECTPNCDAKQCGPSGCPGVNCGTCLAGETCLADGVCSACLPQCANSTCGGSDGCGGTCECTLDALDSPYSRRLFLGNRDKLQQQQRVCDHFTPKCTHNAGGVIRPGCKNANEFCASTCECISVNQKLADLSIMDFSVEVDDEYVVVSNTTCAYQEGCLRGTGPRRLLRFNTNVFNQGAAAFELPSPPQRYPDLYEFASCHGHWHIKDFLLYQVLDDAGNVVALGEKRSFCLMDMFQKAPRPDSPCQPRYSCSKQGLSVSWSDEYSATLDCQFIDVTGVAAGSYTVRQCVNPGRKYLEASFENNCVEARVTIGPTRAPVTVLPTPYPTGSSCAAACPASWLGDNYCDTVCNVPACNYDHGDCDAEMTCGEEGCLKSYLGDGICDPQCLSPDCQFDLGDCED